MALKAMTLTAGPNATSGQFGFRVTAGTEENTLQSLESKGYIQIEEVQVAPQNQRAAR
jgi:hypothetical protein